MSRSILIDCVKMNIIAASDEPNSAKCMAILADIIKLPDNYLIIGSEAEHFKKSFSFDEMVTLYSNHTGYEVKRAMADTILYQLSNVATNLTPETRNSKELEQALGRPFTVSKIPAPEKASQSKTKAPNSRPRAGTVTGQVWDICDRLYKTGGKLPTKDGVLLMATQAGINASTAQTQFGKWKSTK